MKLIGIISGLFYLYLCCWMLKVLLVRCFTHWKNLKALTVNPLEENKSFNTSSLTEELGDREGRKLFNMLKNKRTRFVHCWVVVWE